MEKFDLTCKVKILKVKISRKKEVKGLEVKLIMMDLAMTAHKLILRKWRMKRKLIVEAQVAAVARDI